MKRIITLITVFAVISGVLIAQDQQEPDFFTGQFNAQETMTGRLRVVQNAAADGVGTDFFAHALDTVLTYFPNVQSANETKAADDLALFLSAKLGEAQHTASGRNLWRVVDTFTNPLVRAEALASMGKVQAVDFFPQVIQLLSDLNLEPGQDPISREQVAYGAVIGLEEYKDSDGYLPVFLASVGWYSDRVKNKAREALPNIMDNPTEPLLSVIRSSSYNYATKYGALQTLEASEVTTQQKSQGAVASLSEAWRSSTNVVTQRTILVNTRKLSLNMIRRYGTEDANVYPLMERSYREGSDEDEQIAVIQALSALATDDSARLLSVFLNDINTRQARGTLTREDERLVRVIIPALGNTGRPLARNALRRVLQEDWTSTVQKLAQDALKKIP
ncbi:MAG: HEAT repeat domain-containing protein [Treponema sp.]|nr:HEAT repeat domain-containing protein [Treponema sp.]